MCKSIWTSLLWRLSFSAAWLSLSVCSAYATSLFVIEFHRRLELSSESGRVSAWSCNHCSALNGGFSCSRCNHKSRSKESSMHSALVHETLMAMIDDKVRSPLLHTASSLHNGVLTCVFVFAFELFRD